MRVKESRCVYKPLLNFNELIFIERGITPNGEHFCDEYFRHNSKAGGGLTITSATIDTLDGSGRFARLTVPGMQKGASYTVTINSVRDRAKTPNSVAAGSSFSFTYAQKTEFVCSYFPTSTPRAVPPDFAMPTPDIVMIHLGTNDILHETDGRPAIVARTIGELGARKMAAKWFSGLNSYFCRMVSGEFAKTFAVPVAGDALRLTGNN